MNRRVNFAPLWRAVFSERIINYTFMTSSRRRRDNKRDTMIFIVRQARYVCFVHCSRNPGAWRHSMDIARASSSSSLVGRGNRRRRMRGPFLRKSRERASERSFFFVRAGPRIPLDEEGLSILAIRFSPVSVERANDIRSRPAGKFRSFWKKYFQEIYYRARLATMRDDDIVRQRCVVISQRRGD